MIKNPKVMLIINHMLNYLGVNLKEITKAIHFILFLLSFPQEKYSFQWKSVRISSWLQVHYHQLLFFLCLCACICVLSEHACKCARVWRTRRLSQLLSRDRLTSKALASSCSFPSVLELQVCDTVLGFVCGSWLYIQTLALMLFSKVFAKSAFALAPQLFCFKKKIVDQNSDSSMCHQFLRGPLEVVYVFTIIHYFMLSGVSFLFLFLTHQTGLLNDIASKL